MTRTNIGDIELDVALVNGAGAFNVHADDGAPRAPLDAARQLGAYVTKTVTAAPRVGNPQPWVSAWPGGGLVNSVGLANPGCHVALADWETDLRGLGIPVILSLAGSIDELVAMAGQVVDHAPWLAGIELNLSCPNRPGAATTQAADPEAVLACVRATRARYAGPLLAKLSPLCSDIGLSAKAAEQGGADAVTVCNTLPVRAVDRDGRQLLGVPEGGMSGAPLLGVSLRCVSRVREATGLTIIGLGGVDSPITAQAMLEAGADVVGVGSAAAMDPALVQRLAASLRPTFVG